jgi:tetratricopeptide (TPR) repeat protein
MIRFMSVLLALIVATTPVTGAAAPDSAARQAFEEGRRAYNLGQFQEAVVAFETSYRLSGDPLLLFNVGQSHRQAGQLELALNAYRAYLRELPSAANRPYVESKIAELQARASTAPPATSTTLTRPPSLLATDISDPFSRGEPAAPSRRPLPGWAPWVGTAVTGLLLAGAVSATASASSRRKDLEDRCGPPRGGCTDSEVDALEARANLRNLLWAASAAVGVATGVAFYLNAGPGRTELALGVRF